LIPDRRAASAQNKPAPPPVTAAIDEAEWVQIVIPTGATCPGLPWKRSGGTRGSLKHLHKLPPAQLTLRSPASLPPPRTPRKSPHRRLVSPWPTILLPTHESPSP
jgi:hypothetical protein